MKETNILQHTTQLALYMCEKYINEKETAVDCTCGNGKDTLWLAKRAGKVYAFDIQKDAIENTRGLLESEGVETGPEGKAVLINDSHDKIDAYVSEPPCVILFNLGFLPGGDKSITTKVDTSLLAIKKSLELLKVGGLLSITLYPGHDEGNEEKKMILSWAQSLESKTYHCVFANMLNQSERAPQILWITKKR